MTKQHFTLMRRETSDQGTFGELLDEAGQHICFAGELPELGGTPEVQNERSVDCIPCGTYTCAMRYSPKFKKELYEVQNVPGRSGVLIHTGNTCGNKARGFRSDVEGCILPGRKMGVIAGQKAVLESTLALEQFYYLTKWQPFTLTISKTY